MEVASADTPLIHGFLLVLQDNNELIAYHKDLMDLKKRFCSTYLNVVSLYIKEYHHSACTPYNLMDLVFMEEIPMNYAQYNPLMVKVNAILMEIKSDFLSQYISVRICLLKARMVISQLQS